MSDLLTILKTNNAMAFKLLKPRLPQLVKGVRVLRVVSRVDWAKDLIAAGADVHEIDEDNENALFGCNNPDMCKFLLKMGCNVNQLNNKGYHALSSTRTVRVAKLMVLYNACIKTCGHDGRNLLHQIPCSDDYDDVFEYVLSLGIDVNATDNDRSSLLHKEISARRATMLLKAGANIHARDKRGNSVLYHQLNPSLVKVLLDAGVDVNATDVFGHSALHCIGLPKEVYDLLIERNIDMNTRCSCVRQLLPFAFVVNSELAMHLMLQGMDVCGEEYYVRRAKFLQFITLMT